MRISVQSEEIILWRRVDGTRVSQHLFAHHAVEGGIVVRRVCEKTRAVFKTSHNDPEALAFAVRHDRVGFNSRASLWRLHDLGALRGVDTLLISLRIFPLPAALHRSRRIDSSRVFGHV